MVINEHLSKVLQAQDDATLHISSPEFLPVVQGDGCSGRIPFDRLRWRIEDQGSETACPSSFIVQEQ